MHKLKICTNSFFVKIAHFNCKLQSSKPYAKIHCIFQKQNIICIVQHHMQFSKPICNVNYPRCGKRPKNTRLLYCTMQLTEKHVQFKTKYASNIFLIFIIFQLMLFQNQVHTSYFNVSNCTMEREERKSVGLQVFGLDRKWTQNKIAVTQ